MLDWHNGVTGDTMSRKAAKLKAEWKSLRGRRATSTEMEKFAKSLGRRRRKKKGGDGLWESTVFSELRSVVIPSHPGDLKIGTKQAILKVLLTDVDSWEAKEGDEYDTD